MSIGVYPPLLFAATKKAYCKALHLLYVLCHSASVHTFSEFDMVNDIAIALVKSSCTFPYMNRNSYLRISVSGHQAFSEPFPIVAPPKLYISFGISFDPGFKVTLMSD